MEFNYQVDSTLPKLAWLAELKKGQNCIEVIHGSLVETKADFFFEGVWDGNFSEGRFDISTACFGSGARLSEDSVSFATPIYSAERIYVLRKQDSLYLSNSFVFLLTHTGEDLKPSYPFYARDLDCMRLGIHDYVKSLPLKSARHVMIYMHRNIQIDKNLQIKEQLKPVDHEFKNYADYRNYVSEKTACIAKNYQSPSRKFQYHPITTISQGYDSPMVSIFAKEVGCSKALTINNARRYQTAADDSGVEIGKYLHMEVLEAARDSYKKKNHFPEAEFLISGGGGQEVLFSAFENTLPGSVLFTGCSLGRVLDANSKKDYFNQLKLGDASSSSWLEFRLRVGFIYLPLGFLGFQQQNSIRDITKSDEMKPFFMSGNYNKPIARRVIEEAGIPRDAFGIDKKAIAVLFDQEGLDKYFTPESHRDYMQFSKSHLSPLMKLKITYHDARCRLYFIKKRWNYYIARTCQKLKTKTFDLSPKINTMTWMRFPIILRPRRSQHEKTLYRRTNH